MIVADVGWHQLVRDYVTMVIPTAGTFPPLLLRSHYFVPRATNDWYPGRWPRIDGLKIGGLVDKSITWLCSDSKILAGLPKLQLQQYARAEFR